MVLLTHTTRALARHPFVAHMPKLARAIIIQMLCRVLGILEIVTLANLPGVWRTLVVPNCFFRSLVFFGIAFRARVKKLLVPLHGRFKTGILGTCRKNIA